MPPKLPTGGGPFFERRAFKVRTLIRVSRKVPNLTARKMQTRTSWPWELPQIDPKDVDLQFIPNREGKFDYSEDRPEQRQMAALITQAFNESKHALIEAGTGTGKSKAYLVPSLLFGLKKQFPCHHLDLHQELTGPTLFQGDPPHQGNHKPKAPGGNAEREKELRLRAEF